MTAQQTSPLIVGFVSNLMFTTPIENSAAALGYRVVWVETAETIGTPGPAAAPEKPGEMLHGREGQLFTKVTNWQPALLIFDLTNQAIPWERWIALLKSSAATRRMPILCFGPHEDVATLERAKKAGADVVIGRSRFSSDLPHLIQQHARVPDQTVLADVCQQPLSELGRKGILLFNEGQFFAAHEELEHAWNEDQSAGRELYRGILQIAVAYLQIERGNYRGAIKMFMRVRQWLDPFPAVCRGVDVAALRNSAQFVYETLQELGPERLAQLDRTLFQPVKFRQQ